MEKRGISENIVFYSSLVLVAIIAVWSVAFNGNFTVVADKVFEVLTVDLDGCTYYQCWYFLDL